MDINYSRTAATLCSFIASCQRHAIDPFPYLRDLLARISACPINNLGQFLPDRWRNAADQNTPMVWDSPPAEVQ
ncbi:MAG: transposase domain-containing protein [Phycisphaerae bacterium]